MDVLKTITSSNFARILFPLIILAGYAVLPAILRLFGSENPFFPKLEYLTCTAVICIFIGTLLPIPIHRIRKIDVRPEMFVFCTFLCFAIFVLVVCLTAEQVPIVASLRGADAETIAVLREQFLKARVGWQSSFVYLNAAFAGFLIPYSLALTFLNRYRFRWLYFATFLLYTISFSEKAFFLKAMLPLLYLIVQKRIHSYFGGISILACMGGLLIAVTAFSKLGSMGDPGGEFFTAQYRALDPMDYMVWRALAIPLVTAADALKEFHEQFEDELQWGATSSFIARITGRDTIPFERLVFAAQWGQNATGTGSSNSVYITEAYVNFGAPGVAGFSLLVGIILRFFSKTKDMAFESLWMLFALNVYAAGLIGTLLSNGLIIVLLLAAFVRFKGGSRPDNKHQLFAQPNIA